MHRFLQSLFRPWTPSAWFSHVAFLDNSLFFEGPIYFGYNVTCVCLCAFVRVLCVPASTRAFSFCLLSAELVSFFSFGTLWLLPLCVLLLSLSLFFWDLKYKYDGPFYVSHVSSVLSIPPSPYSSVLVVSVYSVSEFTRLVLCSAEFSVKPSDECLMRDSWSHRSTMSMWFLHTR